MTPTTRAYEVGDNLRSLRSYDQDAGIQGGVSDIFWKTPPCAQDGSKQD